VSGLRIYEGRYSVRVEDCEDFSFEQYGCDFGNPVVEATAASPERMLKDAELVSAALSRGRITHRFEIYDSKNSLIDIFKFPNTSTDT
jgi:hypothetical protein